MNTFLENNTNEIKEYMDWIRQLKKETSNRFLEKFYHDGVQIEDYRLWAGIAKRKFMGFSYTSSFWLSMVDNFIIDLKDGSKQESKSEA